MGLNLKGQFLVIQIVLLIFSCLASATSPETPKTLTFSQTKLGSTFTCAHEALTLAYKNIGIEALFLTLPGKRSLMYANNGEVDGEMLRVEGLEAEYPNLLRVPVALCAVDSTVVSNVELNATSFSDLKGIDIGITRGFVDQERLAEKFGLNTTRVVRNEDLVHMLLKGRVTAIFTTELEAKEIIKTNEDHNLYKQSALKRNMYLYHYLHKKNENLLPLITIELRRLQKLGKIELNNREY